MEMMDGINYFDNTSESLNNYTDQNVSQQLSHYQNEIKKEILTA